MPRSIPASACSPCLNTRGIDIFDALTDTPLGTVQTKSSSYTGIAFRPGASEIWTGETSRERPGFHPGDAGLRYGRARRRT